MTDRSVVTPLTAILDRDCSIAMMSPPHARHPAGVAAPRRTDGGALLPAADANIAPRGSDAPHALELALWRVPLEERVARPRRRESGDASHPRAIASKGKEQLDRIAVTASFG